MPIDIKTILGSTYVSGFSGFSGAGSAGTSGFSGFSGAGQSGFSGFSGAGQSGFSGFSSASGFSGYSGFSGRSGFSGFSAASGFSGFSAASGFSGFSAASGFSGFSGQSGFSGFSGAGQSGFSGFSGAGSSLSVSDDTTTNATRYVLFDDATSGTISAINVSSTKLYYNPSTGTLNATVFNSLSDENQKINIVKITNSISTLNQIDGVEFNWQDSGQKSAGVLAQQVEQVLPHLVTTNSDGSKSVNYDGLLAYIIEAIKQLQQK